MYQIFTNYDIVCQLALTGSKGLKNPTNTASLLIWPDFCSPLVTQGLQNSTPLSIVHLFIIRIFKTLL